MFESVQMSRFVAFSCFGFSFYFSRTLAEGIG
jgi:hypothetical protein